MYIYTEYYNKLFLFCGEREENVQLLKKLGTLRIKQVFRLTIHISIFV